MKKLKKYWNKLGRYKTNTYLCTIKLRKTTKGRITF
jgi:hypothetical protein